MNRHVAEKRASRIFIEIYALNSPAPDFSNNLINNSGGAIVTLGELC
jgi:hypothetical protein